MNIKKIYLILFFIIISSLLIFKDYNNNNLLFLFYFIIIINFLTIKIYPIILFKKIYFLLIILIFTFFSTILFSNFNNTDRILKDYFIYLQPILFIFFGYILYSFGISIILFLRLFIVFSFIISIILLYNYFNSINYNIYVFLFSFYNGKAMWYNNFQLFSFIFSIIILKNKLFFIKKRYILINILFSLIYLFFTASRVTYIIIILTFLFYTNLKFLFYKKIYIYLFFAIISFFILFQNNINIQRKQSTYDDGLVNKISNSFIELFSTKFNNNYDITKNYRSYESNIVLNKINNSNISNLFFGHGFGSTIKRPFWIFKDSSSYNDNIPYFHNGYVSVLFKSGILGLLFLFLFFIVYYNFAFSVDLLCDKILLDSLQLSFFVLIFSTYVIHGIYYPGITVFFIPLLLYGYSIGFVKK
jgi:hypothetical protein